ncbi:hypothetical protein ALC56_05917 [Trachymyrmex septentrionalis]|uniref:Uncharacterized protein n=1 Tax=Trachymyrmex septentrionalis TaxID=34720 RepID=A0A195FHE1_9HYME|nr:hypothetical protein ALC56_05917 [Trachymyrmex septentrionalis]
MLTMSTLMMPTTMTTMTNPGPIPAHSVPQKMEPPKLTAAATLTHTPTPVNKSVATKTRKTVLGNSLRQVKLDGDGGVWLRLLPILLHCSTLAESYGFWYSRDPEDRIAASRSPPMGCDAKSRGSTCRGQTSDPGDESGVRLGLPYPKRYNNLTEGSLDNLDRDLLIGEHRIHRRRCKRLQEERTEE